MSKLSHLELEAFVHVRCFVETGLVEDHMRLLEHELQDCLVCSALEPGHL